MAAAANGTGLFCAQHAKLRVLEKRETSRPDRGVMKRELKVYNQRGEMVQDAVQAFLLKRKSA